MPDPEAQHPPSSTVEPVPLSLVGDDDYKFPGSHHHIPSASGSSSDDAPVYSALDSSARLILVHGNDEDHSDHDDEGVYERDVERPLALDFSTDDDDDDDFDDLSTSLSQINGKLSIPPLPPLTLFLYFLSPYLKLGALLLPYYQLPLIYGLSSILVSAVSAVVARHLLYLLARYMRKANLEEVVSHALVSPNKRGKKIERRKGFFQLSVKLGTGLLRVLLTVAYIRECVLLMLPLLTTASPDNFSSTELALTLVFVALALLLSYPRSLASRVVIYTTHLSILTYLLWLATITYSYTQGTLPINSDRWSAKSILYGIATTGFIFTSSNTLPLYASTKGTIQPLLFNASTSLSIPASSSTPATGGTVRTRRDGSLKQPLYRSFKFLSLLSVLTALALILPLVGFAAFPNESSDIPAPGNDIIGIGDMNAPIGYSEQIAPGWKFPDWPGESPVTRIQTYITPTLASLTLLFGTPQLLITVPTFRPAVPGWIRLSHRRGSSPEIISKFGEWFRKTGMSLSLSLLTLLAPILDKSGNLRRVAVVLSLVATFHVPPALHVFTHTFKSPLSIILPSTYPGSSSSSAPESASHSATSLLPDSQGGDTHTPVSAISHVPHPRMLLGASRHRHAFSRQEHDDLLQRKERALQRGQMRRRIIWDICAWVAFLGGFVVLVWGVHVLVDE